MDKKQFLIRRKTIPKLAKTKQSRMKRAMRNALMEEVWRFRFDAIVEAASRNDTQHVALYRRRRGEKGSWDVSHRTPLSTLIRMFLLETNQCWEDIALTGYALAAPAEWQAWHQSYTDTHDNLFLQPKGLNRKEARAWEALPSREFGSF